MADRYNDRRKRILEGLDQGEEISLLELGMYDLTPYFKMDDFDISLSEKIMINKNIERKIKHVNQEVFFSPPQFKALKYLMDNNRVILSAPTSFGKTLLIKEYIFIEKPRVIVYIVPTNALSYELEKSFKENNNFGDYIIYDKCSKIEKGKLQEEKLFFIGTQEKFLEIDSEMIGKVDLFVIDEAYKLQESVNQQRAYKLSETFLDGITRNAKKIFLLTPKARFYGFDKYNFGMFQSDFNAVEKNYVTLNRESFFETLLEKGIKEKTILFCNSPSQINYTYKEIEKKLEKEIGTEFIKLLENDIHPEWSVVKLLKIGILTHHGQMPKYVQNRMINLFNENSKYNILFGTNSISEGINTVTKNLFIHPEYNNFKDILLIKNTVGRAGRLGKYPIGYIYTITEIENIVEDEIDIYLAISNDEELAEIEDTKDDKKILDFSSSNGLESDFCKELIKTYKLSLKKLEKVLNALKRDRKYANISNLPFIANNAFEGEYSGKVNNDKILIKGYLQTFYYNNEEKIYLNNFSDRIIYFKKNNNDDELDNTDIINLYMQFIYSTLEYYIMPLVNIGLEIKEKEKNWKFGRNVVESLEDCKNKYYRKTYGDINIDMLSESHKLIIASMKDYGMTTMIRNINTDILNEIEARLNIRYSTTDVIRAIFLLN